MILVQQDKNMIEQINNMFVQNGSFMTSFKLDKDLINEDIIRLKQQIDSTNNKFNQSNIKYIIKVLQKILSEMDGDTIEYSTEFDLLQNEDIYRLKTYKVDIRNFPLYNIYFRDYINIDENDSLVSIRYSDIKDMLALEIAFKDIGETMETIEEKLYNFGIISVYKSSELREVVMNNINNGKVYELVNSTRIKNSPYIRKNLRKITDYYNLKEFNMDMFSLRTYQNIINFSLKHTMLLVLLELTKKMKDKNISYRLVSINNDGLDIYIENENEIEKYIDLNMVVRIFGRRFEVAPKIEIF